LFIRVFLTKNLENANNLVTMHQLQTLFFRDKKFRKKFPKLAIMTIK